MNEEIAGGMVMLYSSKKHFYYYFSVFDTLKSFLWLYSFAIGVRARMFSCPEKKYFCELFKATFLNTLFCERGKREAIFFQRKEIFFNEKLGQLFCGSQTFTVRQIQAKSYFPNYFLWPKDPLSGSTAKLVDPGPNF
jgi:hypothetical protein